MSARIEIGELVDAIEHVGDQLPEVESGCDARSSPEASGYTSGEVRDIRIVDEVSYAGRVACLLRLDPDGRGFRVVASKGDGRDHVSVSLPDRCRGLAVALAPSELVGVAEKASGWPVI